jgi:UPF0716 protein FxsA
MLAHLFLLFTLVPLVDLYLLFKVGARIGAGLTFGIVVGTGALGAWLAREQGFAVLRRIQEDMTRGVPPTDALLDGALVLAGGVLLITPGFITDAAGFALLVPPVRRAVRAWLAAWAARRIRFQHGVIDV